MILFLSLSSCGGGSSGSASSPINSAILSSIEAITWDPITSTQNICQNQVILTSTTTQILAQDDPTVFEAQFELKLTDLHTLVSSASVTLSLTVNTQAELDEVYTCIDTSTGVFDAFDMADAETVFNRLKTRISITRGDPIIVPITDAVTEPIADQEAPQGPTCAAGYDVCGICDGPGKTDYFKDFDDDALGNPNQTTENCTQPSGYVLNSNDNNDYCNGSTCYVTSTSLGNFCNNVEGCSLNAALENESISTLFFHIEGTTVSTRTFLPTSPILIEKDVDIFACNQVRNTSGTCPDAQQVVFDGSTMRDAGDYNSSTFIIRNTRYNSDPISVELRDALIQNNTKTFGVWAHHTSLTLSGKTTLQNNRGDWAGGLLAGWFIGKTTITMNDHAGIKNNQAINAYSGGESLISNTKLVLNDSAEISHNTSTSGTGGVRLFGNSEMFLNDTSKINNNLGSQGGEFMPLIIPLS